MKRRKFILVDHNEAMQSIRDLEFGEVVEIVDHHRMGGIETVTPINIVARTVGSTAAIITGLYKSSHIKLTRFSRYSSWCCNKRYNVLAVTNDDNI